MITELIPNKTYFQGIARPPFFKEESCVAVNDDGTYATAEYSRYATVSGALERWCETKEEAIRDMIESYYKRYHGKDMSGKADIYQDYVRDIQPFILENYPEYTI